MSLNAQTAMIRLARGLNRQSELNVHVARIVVKLALGQEILKEDAEKLLELNQEIIQLNEQIIKEVEGSVES